MPTVHFGKRAGRTRGRPGDRATADGLVSISVFSSGTDEVGDAQLITLVNGYGGDFTLTDGVDTTSNIAWNASAAVVETRIETDFASVTAASVTGADGGPWTVTLEDDAGPVDDYVGDEAGLTVLSIVVTEAVTGVPNTYQVTEIETDASGGTIVFTFGGDPTSAENYNITSGDLDTALTALNSITDVAVSGTGQSGTPWVVTFADPAGDAGAVTIDVSLATKTGSGTVIVTTTPGVDEVDQVVEIDNDSTSGTFTLLFDAEETDPLAYNAAASVVKQELEELAGIADVTVTGIGTDANPWIVTFVDPPAAVATFTADDSNLNGGATTTVINVTTPGLDRVDEIQSIHVGDASSGTLTVSHGGDTTASIDWDETAADLKIILEAITAITTVNVAGTGQSGDPWLIEFIDPSGAEAEVTTTDSLFATAVGSVTDTTPGVDAVNEEQLVTVNNGTGGTFKLTYDSQEFGTGVAFNVSAADLETALEALGSITAATVTGDAGGPFTVEFVDPGSADLSLMTANVTALTGADASVTVLGTVEGVVNVNETQSFVVDGDTGTYVLTHDGNDTSGLAAAANAGTIESALEGLDSITAVTVTGAGSRKNPFKVVFVTPVGDTGMITATVTSLSNTVVVAARAQGSSDDRE